MELKYIDNISNVSDKSLITVINAIQRRLDKNIDKADTRAILAERQEVFIIEAENRKLEIKEG